MDKPQAHIRPGDADDAAAVAAIVRETLLEHIIASGGDESLVSEEFLRSTLADSSMVVAVVDGEVVGYLQFQVSPPQVMVNGAAVTADYQKQGIGTALFRRCIARAAERGCETVGISVQPTNRSIHQLYLRLGFVEGDNSSGWNQELSMSMTDVQRLLEHAG